MKGVVFTGNRGLEIRNFDDPTPGPDEVVLEIRASGICGTDLHYYREEKPQDMIRGHEPCGVVVARGAGVDAAFAPDGARMMVHHYDGCRTCPNCVTGWTQLCDQGSIVYGRNGDGAHAHYMKVPARTLVPLPEELTFTEGAAVSCGTGTAWGALKRMQMPGGTTIAVIGQGPVGLSATMLASSMGARVIAVDVAQERLARARDFGADTVIDASDGLTEKVREATRGLGADYVMECSGNGEATRQALAATRTWGTICLVGLGGTATFDLGPEIVLRQVNMIGSWTFSVTGQADCARFCADRKLPVGDLFTHSYALEEAEACYKLFDTQTTGKAVILPNG